MNNITLSSRENPNPDQYEKMFRTLNSWSQELKKAALKKAASEVFLSKSSSEIAQKLHEMSRNCAKALDKRISCISDPGEKEIAIQLAVGVKTTFFDTNFQKKLRKKFGGNKIDPNAVRV